MVRIYADGGKKQCAMTFECKKPSGTILNLLCTRIKGHKGVHQWVVGECEFDGNGGYTERKVSK